LSHHSDIQGIKNRTLSLVSCIDDIR